MNQEQLQEMEEENESSEMKSPESVINLIKYGSD